jgi:predicted amidohydrolase YtcJ
MSHPADLLFINARVFTADPAHPAAESVAVQGNRIIFVGNQAAAGEFKGSQTRVIDANGCTLMPGFIDSHFHMMFGALSLDGIQLDRINNYEELVLQVKSYAVEHSNEQWLHGTGLRYDKGPGHVPLSRLHLDEIVSDRPFYLNAYDGHTSWVNTLALKMAGIFHGGESGVNSEIIVDEHGEATGELREQGACKPVTDLIPAPGDARKHALLKEALHLTAQLGVTSIHNMDGDEEQAATYFELEKSGELTCRIYIPFSVSPETPLNALENEALRMKEIYQSGMVRAGAIKMFMDGVIESYTGYLVEPYVDDPSVNGAANFDLSHYNRLVIEADRLGLQIFTHSVGDLGVRRVLDAYDIAGQQNGKRDARHRVEHIEVIHPEDVSRFKKLGVIASMQPLHCPKLIDGDVWLKRVGETRWNFSFAWETLRQAGARLIFGSDWPVVTQNPLRGVSNTLNRLPWKDGLLNHRQTLSDTLVSYTRDAAYGEFQEHQKGRIQNGYLADMVLLSKNIFKTPIEEMENVHPWLTMVDGRVVYES